MKQSIKRGLAAVGALGTSGAFAATDVTAVTAAGADIALVGAAVFGVMVAIKLVKWVRRAL